jgi:hypothetical protein
MHEGCPAAPTSIYKKGKLMVGVADGVQIQYSYVELRGNISLAEHNIELI